MTILLFALLVAIDQITKYITRSNLQNVETIPIINNFFHLTYVENRGAAFGMLQGRSGLFVVMTIVVFFMLFYYYKTQKAKKADKLWMLMTIITLIIAGAVGNLIDRVYFGFVTDMIDFRGIWQFVFNVADIYVVCGTIMLGIYIFMYDKDKV